MVSRWALLKAERLVWRRAASSVDYWVDWLEIEIVWEYERHELERE